METYPTFCLANQTINTLQSFEKVSAPPLMVSHIEFESKSLIELLVFPSDHSCDGDLQLCLVGASWPLGFAVVEKQQDLELGVVLVYGDRLCVRILSINLHTCCGKPWSFYLK